LKKIKLSKYIPHNINEIHNVQLAFLLLDDLKIKDAFYGGAAGGGKSEALFLAGLRYADIPGYNALIIRDTYSNLTKSDGLIPRSFEWFSRFKDVSWSEKRSIWTFGSGATLSFGYLNAPRDHFNFQSAAYQYVGIDEVVNIRENQALYMFSRLRKLSDSGYKAFLKKRNPNITGIEVEKLLKLYKDIPIRFRCASNPPAMEQLSRGSWVKRRYVDPETRKNRVFVPAKMEDNPSLNMKDYKTTLERLDPITRKQLRDGNWDINVKSLFFEVEKIEIINVCPFFRNAVRWWDLGATEEPISGSGKNPDYTVGAKCVICENILYILDIVRGRWNPGKTNKIVKGVVIKDGLFTKQVIAQEPGATGKRDIDFWITTLKGYTVYGKSETGKKYLRARPLASYISQGKVKMLKAFWNQDLIDEFKSFSVNEKDYDHDDIVDAVSGCFSELSMGCDYDSPVTVDGYGKAYLSESEMF
jgi:predicted phage terminase large subunit-like protein